MQDIHIYQIEMQGQMDVKELNANSPLQVFIQRMDLDTTTFTLSTDQSGLIGLMRHLHGLGFVILSVACESNKPGNFEVE